jgi:hypothetical protein
MAAAGSNVGAAARHAGSNAAAAARHAGSNVAAAGSNAAANVVHAAQVPLPSGEQIHRGVGSVAAGTGFASGAVVESVKRGWGRVKQGAGRFLSGGFPNLATAARTGSVDEAFVDYGGKRGKSTWAGCACASTNMKFCAGSQLSMLHKPSANIDRSPIVVRCGFGGRT